MRAAGLAAAAAWLACHVDPAPPRGVVLLCLDTLRADHLGAYGYERPTSPAIDALAAESVVFERAIAQSASTLPSHRALFQSRLASAARPDAPVLAEVLRAAGFRTAAFTGGGNVAAAFGFGRGFERYDEDREGLVSALAELESWLAERGGERFFVFLHTYDVHLPYDPPPPFDTMFGPAYSGPIDGRNSRDVLRRQRGLDGAAARPAKPLSETDQERIVGLYDGGIRYTDGLVGALRRILDRLGLADETLLVLYSDHGEEFADHGSWIHSHTLYDELVRVPLIWHQPGLAPARVAAQVRLMDVGPSLLAAVGVAPPDAFEGESLLPLLAGGDGPARPAVSEMHKSKSLSVWPWKLIGDGTHFELFDLSRDPHERTDRAADEPQRLAELVAALGRALGTASAAPVAVPETDERAISPDLEDRLRELGYLE